MDKIVLKSTLERLVGYIKAAISGKADASELKDVKKQVENKADLVDGKVPLAQLGNIDTQVMLVVDKLPNTDIKANKIYLVKNTDSTEDQNVYTEYVYVNWKWEKLGEFKPEVDLSHIEAKLDTKANITDVDNRFDDLQNYCFKLGDDGSVAAPYKHITNPKSKLNVQTLKNDKEYTYGGINNITRPDSEYSIYDKTLGKNIEITTRNNIVLNQQGSFFRTSKPLDLTHTFYLDNEKTGIIENLTQLTIEESNIFANIPYVEVRDNLDDGTVPQYIYDTTDNKYIEVAETFFAGFCTKFNTKEPLDLTHEFYVNILGFWTNAKENSTALGYYAASLGTGSIALGYRTNATGDNSLVLGTVSNANGKYAISIGNTVIGTYDDCIAIGNRAEARFKSSLALGAFSRIGGNYAIALGKNVSNTKSIFGVGFNGVNGIDMDRDNYGLYLKGFGGYDGTNLVVKSGNTETLNPNIKSVQQTINEKADASAIPTKVSQLTNDYGYIRSQSVAYLGEIICKDGIRTKFVGKHPDTNTYLTTEDASDRVANKVFAADGSLFDVGKVLKKAACNVSGNRDDLELGITDVDGTYTFNLIPKVTTKTPGIMYAADKVKLDALPSITAQLDNITAASTAEEVVTKFNALLADLKAKGYMKADE